MKNFNAFLIGSLIVCSKVLIDNKTNTSDNQIQIIVKSHRKLIQKPLIYSENYNGSLWLAYGDFVF